MRIVYKWASSYEDKSEIIPRIVDHMEIDDAGVFVSLDAINVTWYLRETRKVHVLLGSI